MSIIKCEECGKDISDAAESCPGCGCPISHLPAQKSALWGSPIRQRL